MTICGVLSEPIREEIYAIGRRARILTQPYIPSKTVIDFILSPQDQLVLAETWKLIEGTRDRLSATVKLRDVGDELQDFILFFAGDDPGLAIPDYLKVAEPARGSAQAQEKILIDVMKSYHLVSRVRVALYVFDELNSPPITDINHTIAHLRYHLDWLPAAVKPISGKYQRILEGLSKDRRSKHRRQVVRAIRDEAIRWERRLDETSERYHMPTPVRLRDAIKEASAAMATVKVLERFRPDGWTPPADTVACTIKAPFYYNQTVGKMDVVRGFGFGD